MEFSEHRWRSKNDLTLFARDYPSTGGKLPVVCLPGLTRNSSDFEDIALRMADMGRRVIAVDLRGRGCSDFDPNPKNYSLATYIADVRALMRSLELDRAVFVGTSLGGVVTMLLGSKHPEMVAGAILNDIGPSVERAGLLRIGSYVGREVRLHGWSEAARYVRQTNGDVFPDYGDDDWHSFARRLFTQSPDGTLQLNYDPKIVRKVNPLAAVVAPFLMWRAYSRLARSAPLLVVRGERSDILSLRTVQKMRRKAVSFSYAEVPGVGHAPMLSEPAAWGAIRTFLEAVP